MRDLLNARGEFPEKLTVVQDLFLTETAELADIVLPAQAHTEREGTFTSGERRVQRFYQVTRPQGETKADFEIARILGSRLGLDFQWKFPSQIFAKLCEQAHGYAGLTYQKLAEVTEQWPIMGKEDLYFGGTGYANKLGLGVQLPPITSPIDSPNLTSTGGAAGDQGLIAIPIIKLYDQDVMVKSAEVLQDRLTKPFIAMNPVDAQAEKTTDGMTVNVSVNGASAPAVVLIDENIPPGFALVPRRCGIPINQPMSISIRIAETFTA
jgi:NADH-quinone oxidoreductase subunit G